MAMIYNMYILPRIGFYASHLTSLRKDMREKLNKTVQNLMRNLSSDMSFFPTKLIYIPKSMSDLGFKCPTDLITATIMAMIHTAHLQSEDS